MKVLVTGGAGKFGQALKKTDADKYITPGRLELDISSVDSICNFYNENKNIDGIILSANTNTVELWDIGLDDLKKEHRKAEFEKSYSDTIYNNFLLTRLYHKTIKFIIYMTSEFHYDAHAGYRLNKLAGSRFFLGLPNFKEFENICIKVINPIHMDDITSYTKMGVAINDLINNINNHTDEYINYNEN